MKTVTSIISTAGKKNIENSVNSLTIGLLATLILLANVALSAPMVRINIKGYSGTQDETVIYYQSGATAGFDAGYDAYKLTGPNPAPHISQEQGGILLAINGIEYVQQSFSIAIKVSTPASSTFTISASDFAELPLGTSVYLKDCFTGITTNILLGDYRFQLSDTTSNSRFIIFIHGVQQSEQTPVNEIKVTNKTEKKLSIKSTGKDRKDYEVELLNIIDRRSIIRETLAAGNSEEALLDLQNVEKGLYILSISSKKGIVYQSKVLLR
jgi:trimeric autotransporter adhesin